MISLNQLEEMFANMQNQTDWDIEGPLLWGYFFTAFDTKPLEKVAEHLVKYGYDFVSIYQTDDKNLYVLHVERVEKHTPKSLFALNAEHETIAKDFELQSYDGMDVGPLPKN